MTNSANTSQGRLYREYRQGLKQHSLVNMERMATDELSSPVLRRAIADEARERLTTAANQMS